MMNRRINLGSIGYSAADGSFLLGSSNRSSVLPFIVVSLADDSNNGSKSDNNDPYGAYDFNTRFNPSMAIIIVVLLSAFFFMGFFSIYLRRCTTDEGSSRFSRRRGAGNNENGGQGLNREATRGLDRSVIESFPVFTYDLVKGLKTQTKGSECAVCLSDFEDTEMLRLLPKCSHAFHPECIDMWLCSHTTCPVCRTNLVPADESNPTDTDFGVVEPVDSPDQVTIVVDEAGVVSRHGSVRGNASIRETATTSAEEADNDSPILGLSKKEKENSNSDEFRRSYSTGHSLVRLRKDLEKPTEWYIATPSGLTPGLHRSCSFVAMHHSRSQGPSSSYASKLPAASKLGGYDAGCSSQDACGAKSERWGGISMNAAAFIRSFSERPAPSQPRDQRAETAAPVSQQDRMAYFRKTLNWITGRDKDQKAESSHGGSRSSRRPPDQGGSAA
uniref:RING-type E3 ubiquitin transferase n=1 Tax=Araucaria cunninghamii TaxID=56994 RepID=A0A0D6QZZ7_ARACU